MKMEILIFDGEEDAYWWMLCTEKLFKECGTPEETKVTAAVTTLRGHPLPSIPNTPVKPAPPLEPPDIIVVPPPPVVTPEPPDKATVPSLPPPKPPDLGFIRPDSTMPQPPPEPSDTKPTSATPSKPPPPHAVIVFDPGGGLLAASPLGAVVEQRMKGATESGQYGVVRN